MRSRLAKSTPLLIGLALALAWLSGAWWANIDLSEGRFALFMDERITFDGVKRILHPSGFSEFAWSLLDGGDHRYGRSVWNLMAGVAWIPAKLWGESGQIISGRMLQALLLLAAFALFSCRLLRSPWLRVGLVSVLLVAPFTDYYLHMPKPEPLQLVLLALFCGAFFSSSVGWGRFWFFLGAALGTKVSTLPVVTGFVALVPIRIMLKGANRGETGDAARTSLWAFLLGWGISVPILLPGFLAIYLAFQGSRNLARRWPGLGRMHHGGWILATFLVLRSRPMNVWRHSTLGNTGHGADQASVTWESWVRYFLTEWSGSPGWLTNSVLGSMLLMALLASGMAAFRLIRRRDPVESASFRGVVLFFCGLGLNLLVMASVKRLWGFYLYPGWVLMLVGVFVLADREKDCVGKRPMSRNLAGVAVVLVLVQSAWCWAPRWLDRVEALSRRTESPDYRAQLSMYRQVTSLMEKASAGSPGSALVSFDPKLFIPTDFGRFRFREFWGPYLEWGLRPEWVVLGPDHGRVPVAPPKDSPEYSGFLQARELYLRHVEDPGRSCSAEFCYQRILELPGQGEVLRIRPRIH